MILGLVTILTCQLLGEFGVAALGLSLPGPVLGMMLFLGVLAGVERRAPSRAAGLHRGAERLLAFLPLFFVPAGVGVVQYLDVLLAHPGPVAAGMLGGWVAALLATAGTVRLIAALPWPLGRRRPVRPPGAGR